MNSPASNRPGMRWLCLFLLLVGLAQARELPVKNPIDPAQMRTTDPRWKEVQAYLAAHTPGWYHEPCEQAGNYIQETWTRGPGSNLGLSPGLRESPGTGWYRWAVLHFQLPETFGLHILAGHNPNPSGWGVSFWYARGGRSVLADGCALNFIRWHDGQVVEKLTLAEYYYDFGPDFPVDGERAALMLKQDQELAELWKDVATFRSCALHRLDELEQRVERTLAEHRVQRKTVGKYNGDGIPPPTYLHPLNPEQEAQLLREARAELERRRQLVREHADEFQPMLTELLPDLWRH